MPVNKWAGQEFFITKSLRTITISRLLTGIYLHFRGIFTATLIPRYDFICIASNFCHAMIYLYFLQYETEKKLERELSIIVQNNANTQKYIEKPPHIWTKKKKNKLIAFLEMKIFCGIYLQLKCKPQTWLTRFIKCWFWWKWQVSVIETPAFFSPMNAHKIGFCIARLFIVWLRINWQCVPFSIKALYLRAQSRERTERVHPSRAPKTFISL